jgi:hypothetical protein
MGKDGDEDHGKAEDGAAGAFTYPSIHPFGCALQAGLSIRGSRC